MPLADDSKEHVEALAGSALSTFESIAKAAEAELRPISAGIAPTFANSDSETVTKASGNLSKIQASNQEGYATLAREPAIARVAVVNDDGDEVVYYVSRGAGVSVPDKGVLLASYRSPVGRLAALRIGDVHVLSTQTILSLHRS